MFSGEKRSWPEILFQLLFVLGMFWVCAGELESCRHSQNMEW